MTQLKLAFSPQLLSCKGRHRGVRPRVLVVALSSALALSAAVAADWTGTTSNDWFAMGNWSPVGIPGAATDVFINTVLNNPAAINGGSANAQNITIGDTPAGTGVLAITNAGMLTSMSGTLGAGAGSNGTVNIDGTGGASKWTIANDLVVGQSGNGTLNVNAGGKVGSSYGYVGNQAGSTGAVTVDGAGSNWTNDYHLFVGKDGAGSLTVSNGGTVSAQYGLISPNPGSVGTVIVKGPNSLWTTIAGLQVGGGGTGSLMILNQGSVISGDASIGTFATSTGTATVDGSGSKWAIANDLFVGEFGSGTLNISKGGKVGSGYAYIGREVGSTGAVTVDGAGAIWTNDHLLFVGKDGAGSLTVSNGGTVSTQDGLIGAIQGSTGTVVVKGPNSLWIDTAGLQVGGDGAGSFTILNQGAAQSDNAAIGTFATSTGTATVDGSGSRWIIDHDLVVGGFGSGTLNITNGGVVSAGGNVIVASQTGSVGVLNIGGVTGAPAMAPGILNTPTVQFGAGTGTLNFNHSSNHYVFDPVISGAGTINHNAGNTDLTGNSSGFTGLTNVNGGSLAVNGSLGALVTVNSGGVLGGHGFIGGLQAQTGGIVAPGNSIGTLSVVGNVTQAAGSAYEVELNAAGQSDLIHAAGTATIESGALLKPIRLGAAPLVVGARYTVLQADGGVSGSYLLRNPFLIFTDSYDATHAYLDLAQVKSFAAVGLTPNQKAAGAAAESLGSGNLVYEAVLMSPTDAAAQAAFDQLSGEVHASARSVLLQDSHFARDASLERLRAMDSESVANDGGAGPEEGKQARLLPSLRDLAYWGRAVGSWGHVNGDGNAATVKRDTSGFLMGADRRFGEEGRLGVMGGYSRSAFDVADRSSSGSSDNYHLGAYAGNRWGDIALRTGISYSWHDVLTSRAVAFPGFTDSLKADYKAATTQAFAELGWRIKTGRAEFEPFVNLAHVNVSSDSFTERGGAAALSSADESSGTTFSTLGLRASSDIALSGGGSMTARGSLGWRHAFGNTAPASALSFAGSSAFEMTGAPVAKSVAVLEAGLDFKLTNTATLGVSYGGQFGSGLKEHSARVNLNVAF